MADAYGRPLTDPLRLGNGSASAPTYSFASNTDVGFYLANTDDVFFTRNGSTLIRFDGNVNVASGQQIGFGPNATIAAEAADAILVRDDAAIIAQKNGTTAQKFRVYGTTTGPRYAEMGHNGSVAYFDGDSGTTATALRVAGSTSLSMTSLAANFHLSHSAGQVFTLQSATESKTIASAATTDTTLSVPAGAILFSASVRVTTAIPTAATFTVTTTVGGTTLSTAAVSTAVNSTDSGTAAGASYRSAATQIRITPNLTPATATGVVRVTVWYLVVTPPQA